MAGYRVVKGSFSITPTKPTFEVGEDITLNIKCTLERKNGGGAVLAWSSDYKVYSKDSKLLAQDSREHLTAPWTDIDTGKDDFFINLGAFSPGRLDGYVTVDAHG